MKPFAVLLAFNALAAPITLTAGPSCLLKADPVHLLQSACPFHSCPCGKLAAHFTKCALPANCLLTCHPPVLLQVRGEVHHDRRLHQLMLQEGEKAWNSSRSLPSKPRSARMDITARASISSVALGSPSDSAGSMHAADCSPLDLADPLALYRWGLRFV